VLIIIVLLLFMQYLHVTPAEFHEWICRNDEYSRLLIPSNETDSESIVCAYIAYILMLLLLMLLLLQSLCLCICC